MALKKYEMLPPRYGGRKGKKSPLREHAAESICEFWFSDMKVARITDWPESPTAGKEKSFVRNLVHMCNDEIKEQNLVGRVSAHIRGWDIFLKKHR